MKNLIIDTKLEFFATCWFEVVDVKRPQNFNEKLLLTFTKTFYVKSESLGLLKGSSSWKNKLTLIFLRKASKTRFYEFFFMQMQSISLTKVELEIAF